MSRALSEFAQVNPQVDLPGGADASTPVSFVPMSDVTESGDWVGRQVRKLGDVRNGFTAFADEDVLVAKITPCFENGKGAHVVGLTNGVGFGSTEFHVLRARDGVSPRFVHHITQSKRLRRAAEAYMSGSAGQRRVPRDFFDVFKVPDLSPPEQVHIAKVLDTLDTTIRHTEAIIEKLQQVKQGLLHDLLTRGIDTNGELRPPQNQAPHLYKDSLLGWIPRGWELRSVDQISDSVVDGPFGSNLKTEHYVPVPGVRVVRLQNIGIGDFDDNERAYVSESKAGALSKNQVVGGDVLVAALGDERYPVGRACCYPAELPAAVNKADCFRQRPRKDIAIGPFVMRSLNGAAARRQVRGFEQGVTMQRVNLSNLRKVVLSMPLVAEQQLICERVDALDRTLATNMALMSKLREQKSGLMDDLLTGRVRVTPLLDIAAPA